MKAPAAGRAPRSDRTASESHHGPSGLLGSDDETVALLAELQTEQAERERLRAVYEALGLGSTDPAFARAVAAYAVADVRCANLEAEIERRRNRGGAS